MLGTERLKETFACSVVTVMNDSRAIATTMTNRSPSYVCLELDASFKFGA